MSLEHDENHVWSGVGLIVTGVVAGFVVATLLWGGLVDWSLNRSKFYEGRYEYYFRGANVRGYLDLCPDAGEPGVRFKDECVPPLPSKENQE